MDSFAKNTTYTLYLDAQGNVIYVDTYEVGKVAPNYIYITEVEVEKQSSLVVTDDSGFVAIKGILADGSEVTKYLEVKTATKTVTDGTNSIAKNHNYVVVADVNGDDVYYDLSNDTRINVLKGVVKTGALFAYTEKTEGLSLSPGCGCDRRRGGL